jgi:hypothetical protein
MVDPRLNANPLVDEAHHKVPPGQEMTGCNIRATRRLNLSQFDMRYRPKQVHGDYKNG